MVLVDGQSPHLAESPRVRVRMSMLLVCGVGTKSSPSSLVVHGQTNWCIEVQTTSG